MLLTIVIDGRFVTTRHGETWSESAFPYRLWARYLEVFSEVAVVARVRYGEPEDGAVRCDGPGVVFRPVPYYVGPAQDALRIARVRKAIAHSIPATSAVIMRVPSQLANVAWALLMNRRHPYGLEVVGDPWEVFAPGVVRHPLRAILRRYFRNKLVRECEESAAVAYVTDRILQERYPARRRTASLSSVYITPRQYAVSDVTLDTIGSRDGQAGSNSPVVLFVGSLEQRYKGPDTLLRAVALLKRRGTPLSLRIVGGGRESRSLQNLAARLGIQDGVQFVGRVAPGQEIERELQGAQVFVLPSRTEGLPRALIEAMAAGVPCIASAVGGIPELLEGEDLFPPNDPESVARTLAAVLADPERQRRMIVRNRERAQAFTELVLAPRRRQFYNAVREFTDHWLRTGSAE